MFAAETLKEPPKALRSTFEALRTLYQRRWLLWYMIQRDVSKSYRGSVLGFAWAFLGPLLLIALYTIVFSKILGFRFHPVAGDPSLNFGLYLYCGLIPYQMYANTLNSATGIIQSNSMLVKKMVFPTEILPFVSATSTLAERLFELVVLLALLVAFGHPPGWTIALLPAIFVIQLLFILGLSYLFSVIGAYLPDIKETVRSIVRASFFVTPVIWPADRAKGVFHYIVSLNPIAYFVEAYRDLIISRTLPGAISTLGFTVFSILLFAGGLMLFVRTKHRFPDLI